MAKVAEGHAGDAACRARGRRHGAINPETGLRDDGGSIAEYFYAGIPAARSATRRSRAAPASRRARHPRPAVLMAATVSPGRRGQNAVARRRPHAPAAAATLRAQHDRTRIAQAAARLIAEHGITDWSLAKRKAARQLMLPDARRCRRTTRSMQALAEHHALFGGEAHAAALRRSARRRCVDAPARGVASRCSSAASRPAGRPSTATSASSSSPTTRRRSRSRWRAAASPTPRSPAGDDGGDRGAGVHRSCASTSRARRRSRAVDPDAAAAAQPRRAATTSRGCDGRARVADAARARELRVSARARASQRGRVEREIGQDRVGAGALESRSAPPARRRARRASRCRAAAFSIAYSPRHLVDGGRHAERVLHAAHDVEIGHARA